MTRAQSDIRGRVTDTLEQFPDGLSLIEIHKHAGVRLKSLRVSIKQPHARWYIDRWEARYYRGHVRWMPIYCLSPKYPDAPKPTTQPKLELTRDQDQ